jgi:hypothetical protein
MQFREQQALQEEAARQGLCGLASGFSRHDFIEAGAERGAKLILELIERGEHEEAQKLMATNTWGQGEPEEEDEESRKGMKMSSTESQRKQLEGMTTEQISLWVEQSQKMKSICLWSNLSPAHLCKGMRNDNTMNCLRSCKNC